MLVTTSQGGKVLTLPLVSWPFHRVDGVEVSVSVVADNRNILFLRTLDGPFMKVRRK
jgi:hypothetical protein